MGIPYTRQQAFTVPGGETRCVHLRVPYRGTLTRLVVRQISGDVDGFTLNLFDRQDACPGVSEQDANPEDAELHDPLVHQLMAEQTPGGDALELYALSIPYVNQDEQDLTSRRPHDALWMTVAVGGSGDKGFNVGFTVDQTAEAST